MNAFGTLFFNFSATGGSEVYPMVVADYAAALVKLNQIIVNRLATLVSDVELLYARISDSDVKGDSYPTGISFPQPGTFAVAPADNTYNDALALRVQFNAAVTQRGQRWIRFLPKSQVSNVGVYTPTGPFTAALATHLDYVKNNCSAAHRIPGAIVPPFYTFTPYTGYTITGDLTGRKIGRPFGERRGRRLVA